MALPEAIQRELDMAEAIEAQMATQATPEPDAPNEPPEQKGAEPQVQPVAEAEPEAEKSLWEGKYKTLQSKYDSEVPRLHGQLRELQDQTQRLLGEVEQLKQKPAEPAVPQAPLVNEKDVEAFGGDLVDMASRAARQEIAKAKESWDGEIAKRDQYIAKLEAKLGHVSERQGVMDGEGFFSKLTNAVPNWESFQASDLGQQFLTTRIPGTSNTWDAVLKLAASEMNVEGAVEVFNEMVARYPQLNPETPKPANRDLQRQVAPSKSRSSAPVEGKRMWSQSEWVAALETINRRQVQGAEAEALQAELDAAYGEGRIV